MIMIFKLTVARRVSSDPGASNKTYVSNFQIKPVHISPVQPTFLANKKRKFFPQLEIDLWNLLPKVVVGVGVFLRFQGRLDKFME